MNTIRDNILTLAGGMMHTETLNLLTVLVAVLFTIGAGVAITFALNWHKPKSVHPKAPITITDAQ